MDTRGIVSKVLENHKRRHIRESLPDEYQCSCCPRIFKPKFEFRDRESVKEFMISGTCQVCQDSIFRKVDYMPTTAHLMSITY